MEEISKINWKGFTIKFLYRDKTKPEEGFIFSIYHNEKRLYLSTEIFQTIISCECKAMELIENDEFYKKYIEKDTNKKENPIEPSHYGSKRNIYEAIKIIQHYKLDFCLGNAVKYIIRAGKKDPNKEAEDLKKAIWYLQTKVKELEDAQVNLNNMIQNK